MLKRPKWKPYLTIKQNAKRLGIEVTSAYHYAWRNKLDFKKQRLGRKKSALAAPKIPWHKKAVAMYKSGITNIRMIGDTMRPRQEYHAVYRVIQRYKAYRSQQEYIDESNTVTNKMASRNDNNGERESQ